LQGEDYVARLKIGGKTRVYDPDFCTALVAGDQVKFLKYETGPDVLVKGTSVLYLLLRSESLMLCFPASFLLQSLVSKAVGYDSRRMNTYNLKFEPEDREYVIYEQVFRESWVKACCDEQGHIRLTLELRRLRQRRLPTNRIRQRLIVNRANRMRL
jgi:hypothetical protein